MVNNILQQFSANYKQIIVDEIALEGLEGTGIDLLWRRVEKRLSTVLTAKMKSRYWSFIANNNKLSFYELPEPFPYIEIIDRFTLVDEVSGHLLEPADYLDGPYEYKPVENEYGSCRFYDSRKQIHNIQSISYEELLSEYGNKLAIVANMEERWQALAPHMPMTYLAQMTPIIYCLLELIGKSRDNGQMSVGKSNLHKTINDSKTLFYNRKQLRDLDLIRLQNVTQLIDGRGIKCLLISLKRFNKPGVLSMPKSGMLRNVVDYLLETPNQCERTELLVKKGIFTQKQNRRLQKTVNIFSFEDRLITLENTKSKKPLQKRKYICLAARNDEEPESEEDSNETTLACQYKVGIGLMRQAYEQFLDAGLKGLTQVQLSHLLGLEFYTARAICRIFKLRNIVRKYLEDKGKQRTARFIAVVATEKMEKTYEEQKNKFSEFINQFKKEEQVGTLNNPEPSTTTDEIPAKRFKLDKSSVKVEDDTSETVNIPENDITEIKVIDGFEKSKNLGSIRKNPTLRQLKFANGVLKVLNDKLCITGYMTLSNLASKEINEPPMDTKALKSFIQRLVTDGHIKMYKIKWPGLQRYSILMCARHIKISDPLITAKYKEICMRAAISIKTNTKKETVEDNSVTTHIRHSYPRYMKIRKLHEFIMDIAYFNFVKPESHSLPQGFVCVIDLFPEATIEFLINNMCTSSAAQLYPMISDNQLQLTLKEAPPNIYKGLMKSKIVQNSIKTNLKVLGLLGLVQLVRHQTAVTNTTGTSNFSSFLFYVNRHAKILDTSGMWPRNRTDVKEISYNFETPDDVAKFWTDVYTISTNTDIIISERNKKQILPPLRPASDVETHDTGERFGDGYGACGFDSSFFMEIPRLWQTFFSRSDKSFVPKKKITIKKPKIQPVKKPKCKPKARRPRKRVIERPPPREVPLKRRRPDSSVKFSKEEDLIITICKAAITIMSPNSQPGILIVRNIVAKDLLSIKDPRKTKGICHSRAVTIDSNITMIHEKQCIINEMRRRRNLVQKYEGLLKKLRLKFSTNMTKFINKARIPMLELVWIILKVMKSKSYTQKMPCVALNLQDFHKHFTITTSTANKLCNMYKLSDNATLREAIIFTVMQSFNSELDAETAKKVYATFQQYPETALRSTVEHLRKCSAIAAKEKLFNNHYRKLDLEDIAQSSYKISVVYSRKWICRLNSDFTEKLAKIIDTVDFENAIKGSAEMNCAVCELEICDIVEIESNTVPVIADDRGVPIKTGGMSALAIDTKYSLKTGRMKLHKKSDIELSELNKCSDFPAAIEYVSRCGTTLKSELKNKKLNMSDKLISYLKQKGEKGASYMELQENLEYDDKTLLDKLLKLESSNVIKRVGFYENTIILTEHIKSWTTIIEDKHVICTPWMKITSGIKIDVFLKWTSMVMNIIFEKPGCSIAYISDKCEFLTYRGVQDICMFLEKIQCVTLKIVQITQPDLFSDIDNEPIFFDFNPYYTQECIMAFPTKNCVTRYSYLRRAIANYYSANNYDVDM